MIRVTLAYNPQAKQADRSRVIPGKHRVHQAETAGCTYCGQQARWLCEQCGLHFCSPQGCARQPQTKKHVCPNGKPFVQHYQPKKVTDAAYSLAALLNPFQPATPLNGPVYVHGMLTYRWRKSETLRNKAANWLPKDTAPDLENLSKMVCDVLEAMKFVHNDSQIARMLWWKEWGSFSRMVLRIGEMGRTWEERDWWKKYMF